MEYEVISKKEVLDTIFKIYSDKSLLNVYPERPRVSCEELISKIDEIPSASLHESIMDRVKKRTDDIRNKKYSDDNLKNIAIQTIVINEIFDLVETILINKSEREK